MRFTSVLLSKIPKKYQYSNYPERYIKKQTEFIEWKTPPYPNYQPRTVRYRKNAYYDVHRPWTSDFQEQNSAHIKHPKIYVEPIKEWYMFVGDTVEILRGKDKGKKGIINYIVHERNWVFVKGLNLRYSLQQRDQNYPGMIHVEEKPLLIPRDVALVDPEVNEPTEVEWRFDEEGNEVRVSLKTGRIIPIPRKSFETVDFTAKEAYIDQAKDTAPSEVNKTTFEPKLKTFEMDIMDEMNIHETRIPYPMYWY